MLRGEKPIELGNSWLSAKSILVEHSKHMYLGVELFLGKGGPKPYQAQEIYEYQLHCAIDRHMVLRSCVKRETAQTAR